MTDLAINWSYKRNPIALSFILSVPEKPAFVLSGPSFDFERIGTSDAASARKIIH